MSKMWLHVNYKNNLIPIKPNYERRYALQIWKKIILHWIGNILLLAKKAKYYKKMKTE